MSKNSHAEKDFHYINPRYSVKINGEKNATNKNLHKNSKDISNDNSKSSTKNKCDNNMFRYQDNIQPEKNPHICDELAFIGKCEMFENYKYVPYYEKKDE